MSACLRFGVGDEFISSQKLIVDEVWKVKSLNFLRDFGVFLSIL